MDGRLELGCQGGAVNLVDAGGLMPTAIWIARVWFPIILTASVGGFLGPRLPGFVSLHNRCCRVVVALDREARPH